MNQKTTMNPYRKIMRNISKLYWGIFLFFILATVVISLLGAILSVDITSGPASLVMLVALLPGMLSVFGLIPYIYKMVRLFLDARRYDKENLEQQMAGTSNADNSKPSQAVPLPSPAHTNAANLHTPKVYVPDNEPDALYLLNCPPSRGDTMLTTLELLVKESIPTLLWAVTWHGGFSHADGAGGYLPIPKTVLHSLNANILVSWIRAQHFMDDTDLSSLVTDSQVIAWCDSHRPNSGAVQAACTPNNTPSDGSMQEKSTYHDKPYFMHKVITYLDKQYFILCVEIFSGSGMAANLPSNSRYYLVPQDFWNKNKDKSCSVHISALPKGWDYYDKEGIQLVLEKGQPDTNAALIQSIARLDVELLELFGAVKNMKSLRYQELFVTEYLDSQHYTAVIVDLTSNWFYNAFFSSLTQGGYTTFSLEKNGTAIPLERVREFANKSTDPRAARYTDLTCDNWQEVIFMEQKNERNLSVTPEKSTTSI